MTPRDHAPRKTERPWKLGRLEYILLAIIALGIAITVTIAILDPQA